MINHRLMAFVFIVVPPLAGNYADAGAAPAPNITETHFRKPAHRLAVNSSHGCFVNKDGTIRCWGENTDGQLGTGVSQKQTTPITVGNLKDAIAITAGNAHTCALLKNGTARCWGENEDGRLGDGTNRDRQSPVTVTGLTNIVAITAGFRHTCALLKDGTASCWGWNAHGALGNGTTTGQPTAVPFAVTGLTDVVAITAGGFHSCALLKNGTVRCWGDNRKGQIGNGQMTRLEKIPVSVTGLRNVTAIAAGFDYTCALQQDGTARCWGDNEFGQLGDDSKLARQTPGLAVKLDPSMAITAGMTNSCALLNSWSVRCWGANYEGQLGSGTNETHIIPVPVHGLSNSLAISTGGSGHSCAVVRDGTVRCWGNNSDGQLGDGTNQTRFSPTLVTKLNVRKRLLPGAPIVAPC